MSRLLSRPHLAAAAALGFIFVSACNGHTPDPPSPKGSEASGADSGNAGVGAGASGGDSGESGPGSEEPPILTSSHLTGLGSTIAADRLTITVDRAEVLEDLHAVRIATTWTNTGVNDRNGCFLVNWLMVTDSPTEVGKIDHRVLHAECEGGPVGTKWLKYNQFPLPPANQPLELYFLQTDADKRWTLAGRVTIPQTEFTLPMPPAQPYPSEEANG